MRSQARRSHASMWSHDNRDLRSVALEAVIGRKSGGRERRVGRWRVMGRGTGGRETGRRERSGATMCEVNKHVKCE
jgi:hypothetical protein